MGRCTARFADHKADGAAAGGRRDRELQARAAPLHRRRRRQARGPTRTPFPPETMGHADDALFGRRDAHLKAG
jgi:hypothetical protein